jgi:hypothetical protein
MPGLGGEAQPVHRGDPAESLRQAGHHDPASLLGYEPTIEIVLP